MSSIDPVADRPAPRHLPPDLAELYMQARTVATERRLGDPDAPPYMFDRFEIYDAFIGGMGVVLEGHDPQLRRKVAIKFWKQSGQEAHAAVLAEAQRLARLSHRNVVTIYELGTWGERVFFVMEWIAGMDGHTWIRKRPSWQEVRDVFMAAGHGLAAAHEAGIQHCDFKPANMLIGNDGRVVVADFGVADSLGGTVEYMAPERLRGERGDARSDQFSFCVSLCEALFGDEDAPPSEVPEWLLAVVDRGLAANPDERWASMGELLLALAHVPEEGEAIAIAPPVIDAARASGQRRGFWAGVVSATVVFSTAWFCAERRELPGHAGADTTTSAAASESWEPEASDLPAVEALSAEVAAVIEMIEAGEIEEAYAEWMAESERRIAAEERVDADAIAVGEAFLAQAELAASKGLDADAIVAAFGARACGEQAVKNLDKHGESTELANDLIERAKAISRSK